MLQVMLLAAMACPAATAAHPRPERPRRPRYIRSRVDRRPGFRATDRCAPEGVRLSVQHDHFRVVSPTRRTVMQACSGRPGNANGRPHGLPFGTTKVMCAVDHLVRLYSYPLAVARSSGRRAASAAHPRQLAAVRQLLLRSRRLSIRKHPEEVGHKRS